MILLLLLVHSSSIATGQLNHLPSNSSDFDETTMAVPSYVCSPSIGTLGHHGKAEAAGREVLNASRAIEPSLGTFLLHPPPALLWPDTFWGSGCHHPNPRAAPELPQHTSNEGIKVLTPPAGGRMLCWGVTPASGLSHLSSIPLGSGQLQVGESRRCPGEAWKSPHACPQPGAELQPQDRAHLPGFVSFLRHCSILCVG